MKELQDQLTEITQALSEIFKKVNQMKRHIGKRLPVSAVGSRAVRRPGRQESGRKTGVREETVIDLIYKAIRRSRKGISIVQLKNKTALDDRQISNALYKLTKKGLVHTQSRGVYIKS